MLEAGLTLNNPNFCSLAHYMLGCASHSFLDSLDLNFIYAVIITEGQHETFLLEYNNYITHVVSQNQFIVPRHSP